MAMWLYLNNQLTSIASDRTTDLVLLQVACFHKNQHLAAFG